MKGFIMTSSIFRTHSLVHMYKHMLLKSDKDPPSFDGDFS